MNPSAPAFSSPKKTPGGNGNATKLSAAAAPFVPPAKAAASKAPAANAQEEPVAPPAMEQHVDPVKTTSSLLPTDTAKAPPPPSAEPKKTADARAPPEVFEHEEGGDDSPAAPLSGVELLEKQVEELPAAAPVDWSESRLPELFGCPKTEAKATSEPIRLNATWELYADDHGAITDSLTAAMGSVMLSGGSGGTAPSFDPTLVSVVSDLEAFWRLWRHLPPPSACPVPFTYSWFRSDIKPDWEHPRNKRGGIITIVVYDRDKVGLSDTQALNDVWMATLMGCAGESFAESATILNGVMLKLRPNNRPVTMQLWFANSDSSRLRPFANSFRETIGKIIGAKWLQKLEFYSHHQRQSANNTLASRMNVKPKATPDHIF